MTKVHHPPTTAPARLAAASDPVVRGLRSPAPQLIDHSPRQLMQRRAIRQAFGGAAVMQLGKKNYPYGSADEVPHVHMNGPDSHLKILGSRGLKRYNIVQNGKRDAQAAKALAEAQASGNTTLTSVVQGLIDAV